MTLDVAATLHCVVPVGLGGGGVFMPGFNVPVTFGTWLDTYLQQGPWNVVVIMIGECSGVVCLCLQAVHSVAAK